VAGITSTLNQNLHHTRSNYTTPISSKTL